MGKYAGDFIDAFCLGRECNSGKHFPQCVYSGPLPLYVHAGIFKSLYACRWVQVHNIANVQTFLLFVSDLFATNSQFHTVLIPPQHTLFRPARHGTVKNRMGS